MEKGKVFLHENARRIAIALAIVFLALAIYYVTAQRNVTALRMLNERIGEVIDMKNGDVIQQSFELGDYANMEDKRVSVAAATYSKRMYSGVITLSVSDEQGNIVSEKTYDCRSVEDGQSLEIQIGQAQPETTFTLTVSLQGFVDKNTQFALWLALPDEEKGSVQCHENAIQNGVAIEEGSLYMCLNGLDRERGIERMYYYLIGLCVVGAVYCMLPKRSKQSEVH